MITATVISGFVLALTAPLLTRWRSSLACYILTLLPLGLTSYFALQVSSIAAGQHLVESFAWMPSLGIHLSFYIDGLGVLFALLISGVGTLIVFYAGAYLAGNPQLGRFYLYLLAFMASMLGVVLSANLITLFIFWELTSITSYFLIGFEHEREEARSSALQALLVTGIGGLALLAGFLLMGHVGGSLEIRELLNQADVIQAHHLYKSILVLILAGAFTKSAQTPFHFWLPNAMEAPTPVSAYLHSVTMVKAGVYLLLRLNPILGGTDIWNLSLGFFGALTMVTGAAMMVVQRDIKRLLAYSTVSGLGTMVFLIGLNTNTALLAAVVFLTAHSLYKGSLFLTAGAISHAAGTRDLDQMGDLARHIPLIALAAILAGLSMAGLPPTFGFIAKESLYQTVLGAPQLTIILTGIGFFTGITMVFAAGILAIPPFFGKSPNPPTHYHSLPIHLWLGPVVLAALGLLIGIAPQLVAHSFISPVLQSVNPPAQDIHLSLWHGFNPILFLSLLTIASGGIAYAFRKPLLQFLAVGARLGRIGPLQWYHLILEGVKSFAQWQTQILQGGLLRRYILIIFLFAITTVMVTMFQHNGFGIKTELLSIRFFELTICLLMLAAAVITIRSQSRLSAIVAMGVIGYGIALMFILFGAPDLAVTQFIIETMTVILFVLVIYRLPRFVRRPAKYIQARNALVALLGGGLMTALVLAALNAQQGSRLSAFFKANSYLLAHGRNIVNVIIVDFRGMDTLGEITVLALAGTGVFTLLKLRPREEDDVCDL
ncbi:MAG: putative monovalent cation/H+ antiporter subunit A [Desulfobacterales bacterium]|nr:putative monovalent cation/H+ antiporter subunit A [Desulfobacterales bacterium]